MKQVLFACLMLAVSAPASAQVARTPWGDPNLNGYWDYRTITPLQRPADLADTAALTAVEAERFEADFNARRAIEGDYDEDRGTRLIAGRTSLIVDPPDGRIPFTPEGRARRAAGRARGADSYEQRGVTERCISRSSFPRTPTLYNNFYQILQTPGHVVIYSEMIHDTRVIPLDDGSHVDSRIRQIYGDARGHWEDDVLVVDTTNFSDTLGPFLGWTENLHLTERFTPLDDGSISYEFTIDDPTVFETPWTVQIPLKPFEGPLYEYACHEGNRGLPAILAMARAEEH